MYSPTSEALHLPRVPVTYLSQRGFSWVQRHREMMQLLLLLLLFLMLLLLLLMVMMMDSLTETRTTEPAAG